MSALFRLFVLLAVFFGGGVVLIKLLYGVSWGESLEIADQFVLSVATVKRHITNIYGKLAVRSRTQAIARADELDLL